MNRSLTLPVLPRSKLQSAATATVSFCDGISATLSACTGDQ